MELSDSKVYVGVLCVEVCSLAWSDCFSLWWQKKESGELPLVILCRELPILVLVN